MVSPAAAAPRLVKSDACGALTIAAAGIVGSVVVYYSSATTLGWILEASIEAFDRRVIGVDVHIGRLWLHPLSGQLVVHGLKVDNPKGFQGPCLVSASHVYIDLNMSKLIFSKMRSIEISKLHFADPMFCLEYSDEHEGKTNIQVISDFMSQGKRPEPETPDAQPPAKPVKAGPRRQVKLLEVMVKDMMIDYAGRHVHVGDVHYDDFSKEMKDGMGAVDDIVALLFKSVVKTALAASMGPLFARSVL